VKEMKISSLKLKGVRGFQDLTLNLENPLSKEQLRNIVLIGSNGSGKTTILKSIVQCLTTWNHYYGGELMDRTDINVESKQFN
jgi:predicted ATP-dependent endonuclease of OLD family